MFNNKSIMKNLPLRKISFFFIVITLTYSCSIGFTQIDKVYKSYLTAKSYMTSQKNRTKKISAKKQNEDEMTIIFLLIIIGALSLKIFIKGRG